MRSKNKGQKFDADTEWRKDLLYIAWTKEYLLLHKKGSSARQAIRRQFGKKAGPTSDFASFEVMRKFFDTAENGDYDNFVKKFKNPIVEKLTESGLSVFKNEWLMGVILPKDLKSKRND